jgi:hypothetical protein
MKRVAILIEKNQTIGTASNISAILMGELALKHRELFTLNVVDSNNISHSSINYSTVILKVKSSQQILNLIEKINLEDYKSKVTKVIFSSIGQGLHNKFNEYKMTIEKLPTKETSPVGMIIYGEDDIIRALVKKYSLMQ